MEELQGREREAQGQDPSEQHHLEGVAHAVSVSSLLTNGGGFFALMFFSRHYLST